jgi:hypothetical protein
MKPTRPTRRALTAIGIATVAALATALPAEAQAPPAPLTFTELDKGSTFRYIDHPPRARLRNGLPDRTSAGDQLVFMNPLADAAGTSIGRLHAACTVTSTGRINRLEAECVGRVGLSSGSNIFVAAPISFSAEGPVVGAVIGGTGAYAGARGTFTSTSAGRDQRTTITFLP